VAIKRWRVSIFLYRRRWWLTAAAALVALAGVALTPQIAFDFSPWAILDGYEHRLSDAGSLVKSDDSEMLFVLAEAPGGETAISEEGLAWQGEFVKAVKLLPRVKTVWALTEVPGARSPAVLARLEGKLVSADRRYASIAIQPDGLEPTAAQSVSREVDRLLKGSAPPAGWRVYQAGWPAVHAVIMKDLRADQHRLMPLAGVVIAILLVVAFRRPIDVALPLVTITAAMAWFMVFMAVTGQSFGLLSSILPAVLFTIGTANCVHVLTRHIETGELTMLSPRRAALRTLWQMALPCLLTVATTAIGFATLRGAQAEMLHTFARQAVVGLGLLYLALLWLMIGLLPMARRPAPVRATGDDWLARAAVAMSSVASRRPKWVLLIGVVVLAACVGRGQRAKINASVAAVYDDDHPILQAIDIVENHFGGFSEVGVVLEAGDAESLQSPQTDAAVARLAELAEATDRVLAVQPTNGDAGRAVVEPTTGRASRHALTLNVNYEGSRRMCALADRLTAGLNTAFAGLDVRARLGGRTVDYARVIRWVVREFMLSFVGTSVVILTLIGLLFRSVRMGLIAVIPNAAPLAAAWGYIGLRGYDMNISNIIIFSIGLGMAVDDSVHALARFRREIAVDGDVTAAIGRTYRTTGRAIILTTIIIVGGMSVLLGSSFVPTRRFAELIGVTMTAAAVGDILLLPACLKLFWRPRRRRGVSP